MPNDLHTDILVIGAGVTGLGVAAFAQASGNNRHVVVVEAANEPGGYCRTVERDGFVFDYAGHFFHFRDSSIHRFISERLPSDARSALVVKQRRAATVDVDGREVPYPYQANVHQLSPHTRLRCLVDLWHAEHSYAPTATTFRAWLRNKAGGGLCDSFLIPYNEKLYGDLDALDVSCMGRFFPDVRFADVAQATQRPWGYNATFSYPRRGAVTYVDALRRDLDPADLLLDEPVVDIDLAAHIATTTKRRLHYRTLVTTAPLPRTLAMAQVPHDGDVFRNSRVLVFNLGFDAPGRGDVHWLYVARPDVPFYRVGFYSALTSGLTSGLTDTSRLSLYVECGVGTSGDINVDAIRERVMHGLRALGIVTTQRLIAEHHVVMDPAYVHITPASLAETARTRALLREHDVHSIGRYGEWTYCSIEDNLISARALTAQLT